MATTTVAATVANNLTTLANNIGFKCPSTTDYKCSGAEGSGIGTLILPLFNESQWSDGLRVALYLIALLWFFMGVAIGADLFMCAIEEITSKTKVIRVATEGETGKGKDYEELEVRVWNDTVANLTLMALGSSAPEILLSIIEIIGNKFESGPLGPGTIVGSASFNLLVITAVCVLSIPNGATKGINSFTVFLTTGFFSVWAYIWMYIVMSLSSPGRIDIWEAVITFLYFPILVILAYIADKNFCSFGKRSKSEEVELSNLDLLDEEILKKHHPDLIEYMREITTNPKITEEEAAKLIAMRIQANKKKNYGYYRVGALRFMGGGRKVVPRVDPKLKDMLDGSKSSLTGVDLNEPQTNGLFAAKASRVDFTATAVSVLENAKVVQLGVQRVRNLDTAVTVHYETIDGTAEAGSDYIQKKDSLKFGPGEKHKYIEVVIIDDYEWEPDETFFVKLYTDHNDKTVEIGPHSIAEVTIVNDDDPGVFQFTKPSHICKESVGKAQIEIERVNGADGKVEVPYRTKDQSALHGKDYLGGEGVIVFDHNETVKMLEIDIIDDHMFEKDETFMVELGEIDLPGAKLGRLRRTVVTIVSDEEYRKMFDRVVNLAHVNLHQFKMGTETWGQQFVEAMNVNGGDTEGATAMDYVMHFLTFAWKVIFACVPPCSWYGGWLSFCILISMIGIMTAIIGDLATIFGCLISLKPEVTAITFVALGTSLPDLFASRNAAMNEKFADASIGNVTGSNGVNVFLGLGIPWMIASIYHEVKGTKGGFKTQTGTLVTSVVTYSVCAILCIGLLITRRFLGIFGKGELGGPSCTKYTSGIFMMFLWLVYVLVSALVAYGHVASI